MQKLFKKKILAIACIAFLCSCQKQKEIIPSFEFAPYISAYSGGVVNSTSHIRIELAQEIDIVDIGKPIEEKLFSFSPALKGKAYWVSNSVIEFVPDSGALKPATIYKGKFFLDKIFEVKNELKTFTFSFYVQKKSVALNINPIHVLVDNPDEIQLKGQLASNEKLLIKEVKNRLFVNGVDNLSDIRFEQNGNNIDFFIDNIKKTDKEQLLTIIFDGRKMGIEEQIVKEIKIPARNDFSYLSSQLISTPENGIQLVFTEPISTQQDLKGLIEIKETNAYAIQVNDNIVNLFYPSNITDDFITIHVDKGLKNIREKYLNKTHTLKIKTKIESPAIELLSEGIILPNSEQQTINFKAVSLQAVDLQIIRIYESNVLSFLQHNSLNYNYYSYLKHSGRLIYKKTLLLNPREDVCNHWQNYSVNLKNIIRQEPGALYQVILSFKQDYATSPFNTKAMSTQNGDVVNIVNATMTDEDERKWDFSDSYYGDDNDYDYWLYDWEQSENPYHASYYMEDSRKIKTILMASNLGMIVKSNSNNKYWIAVTDILQAKPILGAEVDLYNLQLQKIGNGRTNAEGFVEIETKNKAFIAVASLNKEKTYLKLADGSANSVSKFDVGGTIVKKGLKGFLYGERGVWRPGDTLFLSFILEDRQKSMPKNHPISIELFNSRGQFAYKKIVSNAVNGFYTFAVPTKTDDPTGIWNAYVKVGQATFHKQLRIESIKPNRLKINLTLPENQLQMGSKSPITIQASWLTGAKASGLKTDVEMTLSSARTTFKGYDNYIFDNPIIHFEKKTNTLYKGTLNENGVATFQMPTLASQNMSGMLKANLVCRVYESSGDVSVVSQNYALSPFATYVGVNLNTDTYGQITTNTTHTFKIVTVDALGNPKQCSNLEYKIYKIDWNWWWENNDNDFSTYIHNSSEKPLEVGQISTNSKGIATIDFQIKDENYGRYLVFVKDKVGGHAAGGTFYASSSVDGMADSENPSSVKMLTFATDKSEYEIDESVVVSIPHINTGIALISIENGTEVLNKEWVKVNKDGKTQYKFTVDKRMTPNVYVHISLLQTHANAGQSKPIRMYGVQPIKVLNKSTILNPQIICPKSVRPEKPFAIKIKEENGKPMTYTLALVDEGLLDLNNFKTPNPWQTFYAREALGISTWDMYDFVIGAFAGKYARMFSIGGDEDLTNANTKANRFNPVVKFLGPFTLKKGEEKTHQIKIPPYIGSLRVMVVAGQQGAYGSAEKNLTVTSPLMLQTTLPRIIGTDETIELPVNVFAMEQSVKDVTVKIQTTGILKINGTSTQKVHFDKSGDKLLNFQLKSSALSGVEKISITATSADGNSFKENIEVEVRNPNSVVTTVQSTLLNAGETLTLPYNMSAQNSKYNLLTLEMATLPPLNIAEQYIYLENYSHYCTEQIVSKVFPLLILDRFKTLSADEKNTIAENVRMAILKIYARQTPDGGFSYWEKEVDANQWVTSYVGHFLTLAKEKGYDINQSVFNKWLNHQRRKSQAYSPANKAERARYNYYQSDLEQAYRLYTLSLCGAAENGAMNRLKENTGMSLQARWRLAAAYAMDGKQKVAADLVFNKPQQIKDYSVSNSTFGSSLRDEAMILETMVLLGQTDAAFRLAKELSKKYASTMNYSTQTSAYMLLALSQLAEKFSGSMVAQWSVNGEQEKSINTAKAVSINEIKPKLSSGKVEVKNQSEGAIYVNLTTKTRPLTDTTGQRGQNLKISMRFEDKQGKILNTETIPQGSDFFAVITVSNLSSTQDYVNLALTCPVASGWEIFNESFYQGAETGQNLGYTFQDVRDDRVITYFDLSKGKSRTFRVRLQALYCGDFVLPAAKCEAMYDGNTFAKTKASRTKVIK